MSNSDLLLNVNCAVIIFVNLTKNHTERATQLTTKEVNCNRNSFLLFPFLSNFIEVDSMWRICFFLILLRWIVCGGYFFCYIKVCVLTCFFLNIERSINIF